MAGLRGVSQNQPTKMDAEEIAEAVYLRYAAGLSWEEVAEKTGRTRRTLYNQRQTDAWKKAAGELLASFRDEGLPVAWGCLHRAAKANDVQAAKELLDRLLGKVKQPHEMNGKFDLTMLGRLSKDTRESMMQDLNGHDPNAPDEKSG